MPASEPIHLPVERLAQPDEESCGPTSLVQILRYLGSDVTLEEVLGRTATNPTGGTLAVHLARTVLDLGFVPTLYPFNLQVFDPSWRSLGTSELAAKLHQRSAWLEHVGLEEKVGAYLDVLERGGRIRLAELDRSLLVGLLSAGLPILTGLSATYLYQSPREREGDYDDVRGEPTGHFVVISGYTPETDHFEVRDPLSDTPFDPSGCYPVEAERLLAAILLGVTTYDAVLLVVERRGGMAGEPDGPPTPGPLERAPRVPLP